MAKTYASEGKTPVIDPAAFVHLDAVLIGEVIAETGGLLGHGAMIHGCTINKNAIGALVPAGKEIPANKRAAGVPAKVIRTLTGFSILDTDPPRPRIRNGTWLPGRTSGIASSEPRRTIPRSPACRNEPPRPGLNGL